MAKRSCAETISARGARDAQAAAHGGHGARAFRADPGAARARAFHHPVVARLCRPFPPHFSVNMPELAPLFRERRIGFY